MTGKGTGSTNRKGEGFAPPNYTQTPNTLFDLLPVISNAELRVTLALVRETHGWHRQRTDMLSVPELAYMAGLSESSAKTGIKEALQRGTLKRFKARDSQNRPTYRYGLAISEGVTREEFERAKKHEENAGQDGPERGSSGQNLTGSEFDGMNGASGQNLPGCPEDSSGQNLPGSYKEERNLIGSKEKREEAALPAREKITPEDLGEDGAEHGANAGHDRTPEQGEANASSAQEDQGSEGRQNGQATGTKNVPGGGRRGDPDTTEAWLRFKFSSAFIDRLLEELPPLGVERARDWFSLPLDRVKELAAEAQRQATKERRVPTCMRDLLDEEARRRNTPVQPAAAGKYDRSEWSD